MSRSWPWQIVSTLALTVACGAWAAADDQPKVSLGDPQVKPGEGGSLFDGKSLAAWRVVDTQDFERHGPVEVKDGAIVLGVGQPASGIVWKGRPPRENYEISLEAKRMEGSDFFCGLTFPVGDSHASFIVGGWGGGVTGLSNIDGYSAVENQTTGYTEFLQDRWYRIRVRVTDKAVAAWIDDDQQFEVEHEDRRFSVWWEQEPMRPLGIATWRTKGALRNMKLTPIDGKAPGNEGSSP
ncbi:MAG: DUF1080 domain-containing protein [Planctomycetes bacterium]|nr:DUF1080 domain-containing protein [Planctomycetota bacterium]